MLLIIANGMHPFLGESNEFSAAGVNSKLLTEELAVRNIVKGAGGGGEEAPKIFIFHFIIKHTFL